MKYLLSVLVLVFAVLCRALFAGVAGNPPSSTTTQPTTAIEGLKKSLQRTQAKESFLPMVERAAPRLQISFTSTQDGRGDIYLENPDGSALVNLTRTAAIDERVPDWSPDGSQVAFASDRAGNPDIYVMQADGKGLLQNTSNPAIDDEPSWSPDGTRLLFHSDRDGNAELYTVNADGSALKRLTNTATNEFAARWSPDGDKIFFIEGQAGSFHLAVMASDGSARSQLTGEGVFQGFDLSPDGSRLVFASGGQLWLMDTAGSEAVQISSLPGLAAFPAWSPLGDRIAFQYSPVNGQASNIFLIHTNGSGLSQVSHHAEPDVRPAWRASLEPVAGGTSDEEIADLLQRMTPQEKVGQLFVLHFDGTTVGPTLDQLLQECHPGGLVLFGPNIASEAQLHQLIQQTQTIARQASAGIPLLIVLDQEGWPVVRLDGIATTFPSQMAIAATGDPEMARQAGQATGQELGALGVNMNLAPVLDVNTNPDNPVIGLRSFGSDPALVAQFGVAMAQGLQESGLLATGKHFPGHGSTWQDSHLVLPRIDKSLAELHAVELKPFQAAIQSGIGAIMAGHLLVPAIDPAYPTSLSPAALNDLLRGELGFQGLIATDSMTMQALTQNYGAQEAARLAVQAGADLLMFGNDPGADPASQIDICRALQDRFQQEDQFAQSVEMSVERILKNKFELGLFDQTAPTSDLETLRTAHQALALSIAQASITRLKDDISQLPLSTNERLLLVYPKVMSGFGELARQFSDSVTLLPVDLSPGADQIQSSLAMAAQSEAVVVVTLNAYTHADQAALVQALAPYDPIVVAMGLPYDILAFPHINAYLTSYGYAPASQRAVLQTLYGEIQPQGKLPVSIGDLFPVGTRLGR
ncbi:MAG: glycoside hydrolase family 3 N-terminal domain-containing protein [Anaerolineales bacterium]